MQGPQLITPNSLFQSIPASLLGLDMSDPSNAMLGRLITDWLKQNMIQPLTGISPTDPLWNATLYTNMTDFGVMMQNMNTAANSRGLSNMMQMQASARYQLLEGWQRTATPIDVFNNMTPEQRGGLTDYEAFIQHKTQGMMDNQILSLLMQSGAWDPTGKMMASAYVREASSNVARDAMWRGDRDFQKQADAVAKVFLDDQMKLDYNKRDYGLMTMNESAAVLAALTKDRGLMDFSPEAQAKTRDIRERMSRQELDVDTGNKQIEEQMKTATQALRDRLKGLTTAMSPLKDFFGDDVPNMIRFLEELSGKSFSELDSGTISNLTRRVSSSLSTGLYTADQMRAVSKQLSQSIGQMDVPFYLDTVTDDIAQTMLTTMNAGITPALMNDTTFRNAISERTIRHAASPFANNVNLAYSNWRHNRQQADIEYNRGKEAAQQRTTDVSFEEFQRQYNSLIRDERMTTENALLQLADAPSVAVMVKNGYGWSGYELATREGLGARMTDSESLRESIDLVARTRDTVEEGNAIRRVYSLFTDENERKGRTTQGMIEYIRSLEFSENAADQQVFEAYQRMSSDKDWEPIMMDLSIQGAQVDANMKIQNADKVKRRTDFIGKLFGDLTSASNPNELLFNLLLGNNNAGANLKDQEMVTRVKSQLSDLAQEANIDQEDMDIMQTLFQVGQAEIEAANGYDENGNVITDKGRAIQRRYLETAQSYMMDKSLYGEQRAKSLAPYEAAARATFADGVDATSEESQLARKAFSYASSMTQEMLDLFAEEDKANGEENSGNALRRFVKENKVEYEKLRAVGSQIRELTKQYPDDKARMILVGSELDRAVKGEATTYLNKDVMELLDKAAPNWRKDWQEAVASDDRTKTDEAKLAYVNTMFERAGIVTGQDADTFFRSSVASYGAYQKARFGKDNKAFQEHEDRAKKSLEANIGHWYRQKENGSDQTIGEKLHEDFLKNVVSGKESLDTWMTNFSGFDQTAQSNIREMYSGLLSEAKANGPQNVDSVGSLSIEQIMSKALGDGTILRQLEESVRGLTNVLAQIPAFIKGAAEKWDIKLS